MDVRRESIIESPTGELGSKIDDDFSSCFQLLGTNLWIWDTKSSFGMK
jgi:hypothetical protein